MERTQPVVQYLGGLANGLPTMHRLVTFKLSIPIPLRIRASMSKASISFRALLFQLNKRIELRQPALAEDLFGESLCTLARAVAHG